MVALALLTAAQLHAQCANSWHALGGQGPNGVVAAMTHWDPDGAGPQPRVVVIGGDFTAVGAMPARGLALFAPSTGTWSTLPGLQPGSRVAALATLPNGDLVVGGLLPNPPAPLPPLGGYLGRWNGTSWSGFGAGLNGQVYTLLVLPNGELLAGGSFTTAGGAPANAVARWDGASWTAMPGLGAHTWGLTSVLDLARRANGDIVAAGLFTAAGGTDLARWDGTSWSAIGAMAQVHTALHVLPNDDVLVGSVWGVHRWNGTAITPVGSGLGIVNDIAVLPDGDLLAAVDAGSLFGVVRWNGTTWSVVAAGVNDECNTLLGDPNGDVWVGGEFTMLGGSWSPFASPHVARLSTTCGATAVPSAAGCVGSGGANVLAPLSLPWTGSTFRARASGMPSSAFVLSVYGFAPLAVPIASVHLAGLPGCTLWATSEIVGLHFPISGAVDTHLQLPDAPSIVGTPFHHYVVPVEVDALLAITAITSSNPLACVVGSF
jgi:hypothetical protein